MDSSGRSSDSRPFGIQSPAETTHQPQQVSRRPSTAHLRHLRQQHQPHHHHHSQFVPSQTEISINKNEKKHINWHNYNIIHVIFITNAGMGMAMVAMEDKTTAEWRQSRSWSQKKILSHNYLNIFCFLNLFFNILMKVFNFWRSENVWPRQKVYGRHTHTFAGWRTISWNHHLAVWLATSERELIQWQSDQQSAVVGANHDRSGVWGSRVLWKKYHFYLNYSHYNHHHHLRLLILRLMMLMLLRESNQDVWNGMEYALAWEDGKKWNGN